jgi:CubicO group peptidase (beta-lactamase class C family)
MKTIHYLLLLVLPIIGCKKSTTSIPPVVEESMYYPTNASTNWDTKTTTSLGWNDAALPQLKNFLTQKNTKSFMILVNGRIVIEEYFNGHTPTATWPWNSAGKTLVSTTTGIAQQEGLININTKVAQYLGTGWTNEPIDKENLITVRHLLTMTTGITDSSEFVIKRNLNYQADAGTRWAYHNVFQKLIDVVAAKSNTNFETYFDAKIKNKIGMDGFWNNGLIFKIYHSNTHSMARFGLLALNKGLWKNEQIINEPFFTESINTSQSINPAYGYLWWLNGKTKYMVPGTQIVYQGQLVPNAPADMYAAMGAEDQRIYVIPSKKMVVIRMGDASDPANPNFALSGFDNELWAAINKVVK